MGDGAQAGASPFFILSLIFLRQLYASTIDPTKDSGVSMIHNDLENSKSFPIQQITNKCWVLFVLNTSNSLPWKLKLSACCLLGLQVFKDIARYVAVKKGSQSFATEKNAKLVASYMNQYLGLDDSPQVTEIEYAETPTEFMSGYKYLVMGEEKQRIEPCREKGYNITVTDESQLITLDKVWAWNGEEPQDQENKELCLSFALFKLLRRKFEGIPLTESGSQRALRLLLHGPFKDHKFAFNIVEVQLSFLQEYFFSTIPLGNGLFFIGLSVVLVLCYYGLIVLLIIEISRPISSQTIYYQTLPIEKAETLFVLEESLCLIILFFLLSRDVYELINYLVSKWRKVTAICQRGSRPRSSAVRHLFNLVSFSKSKYSWGNYNGLNQHSFLKRVESFIEVPDVVKEAIVRSLKENKGQLNSGRTSLNQNGIYDSEIHNACGLESHTERILVWHIATSHCEAQAQQSEFCSVDINVASGLSRYCAYLVTSVPELIPEETEWTKLVVQRVIRQVCFRNHDISRIGGCYFCWDCMIFRRDIVVSEDDGELEQALRFVEMGKELGEKLITEIDESRRWKVLADLWTEMLLYMAPSDNVEAHRDSLCKDGQFITHVWALLSDIGINELPMP
ncbi:uncharacterized protein A4U43_C03F7590 [Asparagus officinalis]|uniref:DUF4220 domain-containing protein n=3 Tax=Asparagus officinalis TaxID=4686 RepID=A0A5P1F9Z9_ASPOF|nr:uncharacterized protein A4U43_C03F7590 [Asparagus officinalis]